MASYLNTVDSVLDNLHLLCQEVHLFTALSMLGKRKASLSSFSTFHCSKTSELAIKLYQQF